MTAGGVFYVLPHHPFIEKNCRNSCLVFTVKLFHNLAHSFKGHKLIIKHKNEVEFDARFCLWTVMYLIFIQSFVSFPLRGVLGKYYCISKLKVDIELPLFFHLKPVTVKFSLKTRINTGKGEGTHWTHFVTSVSLLLVCSFRCCLTCLWNLEIS